MCAGGQRLEPEAGHAGLRVHRYLCHRVPAENAGPWPVPAPRRLHAGHLERHGHLRGVLCPPLLLLQVSVQPKIYIRFKFL